MIVRCGRCGTQFEPPGEGRFACPACGAVNEVRLAQGGPHLETPAPPPPAPSPAPRVECGDCGFRFIVGDIESAPCPNCGSTVPVIPGGEAT